MNAKLSVETKNIARPKTRLDSEYPAEMLADLFSKLKEAGCLYNGKLNNQLLRKFCDAHDIDIQDQRQFACLSSLMSVVQFLKDAGAEPETWLVLHELAISLIGAQKGQKHPLLRIRSGKNGLRYETAKVRGLAVGAVQILISSGENETSALKEVARRLDKFDLRCVGINIGKGTKGSGSWSAVKKWWQKIPEQPSSKGTKSDTKRSDPMTIAKDCYVAIIKGVNVNVSMLSPQQQVDWIFEKYIAPLAPKF